MKYFWFDLPSCTTVVVRAASFKDAIDRFSSIYGDFLLKQVITISVSNRK